MLEDKTLSGFFFPEDIFGNCVKRKAGIGWLRGLYYGLHIFPYTAGHNIVDLHVDNIA